MTTRLSLDDDVAAALAEEAERRGIAVDQLANEELRASFCSEQSKSRKPFRVRPFKTRLQPGMDPRRLKQILQEADSAHFDRVTSESRDHS